MEHKFDLGDILNAYRYGLFPMAEDASSDTFFFYEPEDRGILPIDTFHVSKSLRRTVRQGVFDVTFNTDFRNVIKGCAAPTDKRQKTWINKGIRDIFVALYHAGYAHSVECWRDDKLAGGVFGLAICGVFFGESMFSRQTDASKVALCHLMAHVWRQGFTLVDTQFINPHLLRFGAIEIPQRDYLSRLEIALQGGAKFINADASAHVADIETFNAYIEYLSSGSA